jgi:hypothetical protein
VSISAAISFVLPTLDTTRNSCLQFFYLRDPVVYATGFVLLSAGLSCTVQTFGPLSGGSHLGLGTETIARTYYAGVRPGHCRSDIYSVRRSQQLAPRLRQKDAASETLSQCKGVNASSIQRTGVAIHPTQVMMWRGRGEVRTPITALRRQHTHTHTHTHDRQAGHTMFNKKQLYSSVELPN